VNLSEIIRMANAIATFHTTQRSLAEADAERRRLALEKKEEEAEKRRRWEAEQALDVRKQTAEEQKTAFTQGQTLWEREHMTPYQVAQIQQDRQRTALDFANQMATAWGLRADEADRLAGLKAEVARGATLLTDAVRSGRLPTDSVTPDLVPADLDQFSPEQLQVLAARQQAKLAATGGAKVTWGEPSGRVTFGPGADVQAELTRAKITAQDVDTALANVKLEVAKATTQTQIEQAAANLKKTLAMVDETLANAKYLSTRADLLPEEIALRIQMMENLRRHQMTLEALAADRNAIAKLDAETRARMADSLVALRTAQAGQALGPKVTLFEYVLGMGQAKAGSGRTVTREDITEYMRQYEQMQGGGADPFAEPPPPPPAQAPPALDPRRLRPAGPGRNQ